MCITLRLDGKKKEYIEGICNVEMKQVLITTVARQLGRASDLQPVSKQLVS